VTLDEFFDRYPKGSIFIARFTDINGIKLWGATIDQDYDSDPILKAEGMTPVQALHRLEKLLAKWTPRQSGTGLVGVAGST
jgi:hypothetical protein